VVTLVRWLRGVRRSRSIGHCAQSKKEREEERKKIIVVEYYYYYYYQTQERNAHYYYHTAIYYNVYNTAAVYDIIIEYTRFIESGPPRAEQLLVCTLSYYILLLFYIIYITLSSGGYRVIIPIPSPVIGSCGPPSSFHKTASRQCVRVRPSSSSVRLVHSLLRPRALSPFLWFPTNAARGRDNTDDNDNNIIVVLIIFLLSYPEAWTIIKYAQRFSSRPNSHARARPHPVLTGGGALVLCLGGDAYARRREEFFLLFLRLPSANFIVKSILCRVETRTMSSANGCCCSSST